MVSRCGTVCCTGDEFYQTNANGVLRMCTDNEQEGKDGLCTRGAKIGEAPEPSCDP